MTTIKRTEETDAGFSLSYHDPRNGNNNDQTNGFNNDQTNGFIQS